MVRVRIVEEDYPKEISLSGHAQGGTYPNDVRCAAVSAVWQCGLLCLSENPSLYHLSIRKGASTLKVLAPPSERDRIVLEVIAQELRELAKRFPESVRVETEGGETK